MASVADLLEPGGRLVYSVCTFPRAETDAAADAIVRHRPDLVPVTLDRMRIDPAVSSAVFVTTITDVTGFFSFLGLAAAVGLGS